MSQNWDVAVIGAGVFGAWTAWKLQAEGQRVLLVDAWGPAHARASSGGESRLTRATYGADAVYARWANESLADWRWLSSQADLPILHACGVLVFFTAADAYHRATIATHASLGLATEDLRTGDLPQRWPQVDWSGVEAAVFEPRFGVLMARRAVQTLVELFRRGGGEVRRAAVAPPNLRIGDVRTIDGDLIEANRYVFACGPWLGKLFPDLLAGRLFVTRQEVFFFAPPPGDERFGPAALPGWAEHGPEGFWYGMPDLEARGFKIAHDRHGPPADPDTGDRVPSPAALELARDYLARRFPDLAGRPLNEARVCQYENTSSGDFIIDRHPDCPQAVIVGGGSGHGFKHGPGVGRAAAELVLDTAAAPLPRFALASKATSQRREVH